MQQAPCTIMSPASPTKRMVFSMWQSRLLTALAGIYLLCHVTTGCVSLYPTPISGKDVEWETEVPVSFTERSFCTYLYLETYLLMRKNYCKLLTPHFQSPCFSLYAFIFFLPWRTWNRCTAPSLLLYCLVLFHIAEGSSSI